MHLRLPTILFLLLLCSPPALAWNAAGHRLSALIAWRAMQPATREFVSHTLAEHPDYAGWREKTANGTPAEILAEAACWADRIRHDPRFYDETAESPTPSISGLFDHARHKRWHYVDLDTEGKVRAGEIDRRIADLSQRLRTGDNPGELVWALPWLLHLVGDIHQPLHVGNYGDEGGNTVTIDNPLNRRQTDGSLHRYWDDLPGPAALRGRQLEQKAGQLIASYRPPRQGSVSLWRTESHHLLDLVYPGRNDGILIIDEAFDHQARHIAERRVAEAGWRLGRLLDEIVKARVSRGTR